MDRLEAALHWRPRPDLPLVNRIYRLAEGALALKEIEHAGAVTAGSLPGRLAALADHVLRRPEGRHGLPATGHVTERVKRIRRQVLGRLAEGDLSPDQEGPLRRDLDDVFLAVQLSCYPGDYVSRRPTLERISETLDKLEEDVLGVPIARPRVPRGAIVALGEPIVVDASAARKDGAAALTERLEERVQALLDSIRPPWPMIPSDPPSVEVPS